MNKNILIAVAVVIIGGLAAYYWQYSQPKPEPAHLQAPPTPPLEQEVRQVIVAPSEPLQLPTLVDSDKFIFDSLAGLVGNKSLMRFFHTDRIIHNIVATIDNLPSRNAPMSVMPVERAPSKFVATGTDSDLTISQKNKSRYAPYVRFSDAIDSKKLVELYVSLYPLFQQAYEELGYPKKYFNDRLIMVLNDLLAVPNIKDSVKLVQPNVYYLYADPDLEARSIGQRILMRIGNKNQAIIKTKLREIKNELAVHMHEQKVVSAR